MDWKNGVRPTIFDYRNNTSKRSVQEDLFPKFASSADRDMQKATNYLFDKTVKSEGKFGIQFSFFKNTQKNIVDLIMGNYKNVGIFSITVPKVVISLTISWRFYVWPAPPVAVEFSISGRLVLDIKSVDYTANGLVAFLQSKSVSQLWKGMKLTF